MIKRVLLVLMLILSVAFAINRIDSSKSITTNYLLLSTVEKQNIEQINNVIRFNVPSYQINGNLMNSSPIEISNGYKTVLGSATDGVLLKDQSFDLNNNYAFPFRVEYNNHTKELFIQGVEGFSEQPKIEEFVMENGTKVNLVISR